MKFAKGLGDRGVNLSHWCLLGFLLYFVSEFFCYTFAGIGRKRLTVYIISSTVAAEY